MNPCAEHGPGSAFPRPACVGLQAEGYTAKEIHMKSFKILLAVASLSTGLYIGGCTTSHSEEHKDTMLGGHKDTETTTTKNPVTGDVSTEKKTTSN
jgi:hypothetical protein